MACLENYRKAPGWYNLNLCLYRNPCRKRPYLGAARVAHEAGRMEREFL
jgi:hypothetical protein